MAVKYTFIQNLVTVKKCHHDLWGDLRRKGDEGRRRKRRGKLCPTWWRCQLRVLVSELLVKVGSTCWGYDVRDKGRTDPLVVDIIPVDRLKELVRLDFLCICLPSTKSVRQNGNLLLSSLSPPLLFLTNRFLGSFSSSFPSRDFATCVRLTGYLTSSCRGVASFK